MNFKSVMESVNQAFLWGDSNHDLEENQSKFRGNQTDLDPQFLSSKLATTTSEQTELESFEVCRQIAASSSEFESSAITNLAKPMAIAHNNLGNLYKDKNQWRDASKQYRKAIAIDPQYRAAYWNLAQMLSQLEQTLEATIYFKCAQILNKQKSYGHLCLEQAKNCFSKCAYQAATGYYLQVLRTQPTNWEIYFKLGQCFLELRQIDYAVNYFRQAIAVSDQKSKPILAKYAYQIAQAFEQNKNFAMAISYYLESSKSDQLCWQTYFSLGNIYAQLQQWTVSLQYYREAIQIKPTDYWLLNNAGNVCLELGYFYSAREYYQEAINLNKRGSAWTHYYLGEVFRNLKIWTKSLDAYKAARLINPDLKQINQKIIQIERLVPSNL